MNTRLSLVGFLLLFSATTHSQQNAGPTDSLLTALENSPLQDTNRIWTLLRLTNAYFTSEPGKAMEYADEALRISEGIPWPKGRVMALKVKGGVYYIQSDFISALDFWQQSLTADSGKSRFHEAAIRNNMATVYREFKEYEKARNNYKVYIDIMTEFNNKEELAMGYTNLATVYHLEKKYDSSESSLEKGISLCRETGNKRVESAALCILGSVCKETGRYAESVSYSLESIRKADETSNWYVKAPALNNLAHAYRNLGELSKAEKASLASLELARKFSNPTWEYEAWDELSRIYELQSKPNQALNAHKKYVNLRDSVINTEKKQELTRMEMQMETAKKEAILKAEHEAEVKQQKTKTMSAIGASGLILAGGLYGFVLYKRRKDAYARQQEAELRAEISDMEMKALRAQMNPHFIFNSLNSIGDFTTRNDPETARRYLGKFAQLMRMTLEHSERKEIQLVDELKALDLYLKLEQLRLKDKFTYDIQVDEGIDPENTLVPPLILQPFVENSIWHGIAPKNGPGHIQLLIRQTGDVVSCIVEDNGVGRKLHNLDDNGLPGDGHRKSMGSSITQARIALLNRLNHQDASVTLTDLEQGLRAEIRLPHKTPF